MAGEPNGFGRSVLPGTMHYIGTFREGKPHGYGNWSTIDHTYQGFFVNGKREGNGKLMDHNGKIVFEGMFRNDQPVRAGWQPKPKYKTNSDTNTQQSLGTTADLEVEEEQEVAKMSFSGGLE